MGDVEREGPERGRGYYQDRELLQDWHEAMRLAQRVRSAVSPAEAQALRGQLEEHVAGVDAAARMSRPAPELVRICERHRAGWIELRVLAGALLAGPAGAQGAALCWSACAAPADDGFAVRAYRLLSSLVMCGLLEPVERTPGMAPQQWRYRAGRELAGLVDAATEARRLLMLDDLVPDAARGAAEAPAVPADPPTDPGGRPAAPPAPAVAPDARAAGTGTGTDGGTGGAGAPAEPAPPALGTMRQPRVTMADLVLSAESRESLEEALVLTEPGVRARLRAPELAALFYKARGTVLLFEGPPGTGKTMAAEALASHLKRPLYEARTDALMGLLVGEAERNITLLFEEATRLDAVLFVDEADSLVSARGMTRLPLERLHANMVNLLLTKLEEHDGVVIFATNKGADLDPALERRLAARIRFDMPGAGERLELWKRHLAPLGPLEGECDLAALARRHPLTGARIRNAILTAVRRELRRSGASDAPLRVRAKDLEDAAAEQGRLSFRDRTAAHAGDEPAEIGELRQPKARLADVVMPPALRQSLDEALVLARPEARALLDSAAFQDAYHSTPGLTLLFEGPPGTGKTMTAEAVAAELGRPLYVVGAERVFGMWMGQTEKSIARAFDEAEAHDAVLLLDEADGVLAARTQVHHSADRVYNRVVNIVLTKLESSCGVTIFATNLGATLDPALERRLTARLRFPEPDAAARERILRAHVPAGVELGPGVDLAAVARRWSFSGGVIRQAMLSALRRMMLENPAGRVLAMKHLEPAFNDAQSADKKTMGFAPPED